MIEQLASIHPLLPPVVGVLLLLIGAAVVNLIAKRLLVGAARTFARRTSFTWDDALVEHNVFARLAQVVPALIVFVGVPFIPDLPEGVTRRGLPHLVDPNRAVALSGAAAIVAHLDGCYAGAA